MTSHLLLRPLTWKVSTLNKTVTYRPGLWANY
uniref:Uncharacterized protein n=1 Tax=Podoviridae sp. cty0j11 TaxID=2826592 RepID=A0A8S5MCD6_9CAUD|nr:MAG TPA: hypothetical protein [Podoviridae sp. cty0j11]